MHVIYFRPLLHQPATYSGFFSYSFLTFWWNRASIEIDSFLFPCFYKRNAVENILAPFSPLTLFQPPIFTLKLGSGLVHGVLASFNAIGDKIRYALLAVSAATTWRKLSSFTATLQLHCDLLQCPGSHLELQDS